MTDLHTFPGESNLLCYEEMGDKIAASSSANPISQGLALGLVRYAQQLRVVGCCYSYNIYNTSLYHTPMCHVKNFKTTPEGKTWQYINKRGVSLFFFTRHHKTFERSSRP